MTDRPRNAAVEPGGPSLRERAGELFPGRPTGPASGVEGAVGLNRPRREGRWGLALRERLPLWAQSRCGIEPRALAALTVVLVAACAFAAYHFLAGRPQTVRVPAREAPAAVAAPPSSPAVPAPVVPSAGRTGGAVVVDVAGKVRRPGVLRLPPGSRVADALAAAGGARPGADTTGINRARILVDGEQIVVGAPGATAAPGVPGSSAASGAPAAAGGPAPGTPLSLNAATAEQLDALPGVGPVLARHILDYRTQHGGFRSVEELRRVNGIGSRRFTDLRPLVQP
ncbi:ComEA family DNA-binding protein [Streptomyces rectiverticillatus]|uniref:ComEA family DNA-binding protein n=1 Tax=Streptomyces rectiverticillatus TaxID=173860 RepID=UPI0015C2EDF3|nr:ComEA family DNA-binding protein [Streptomyces rectiverticillatus]QLE72025.1 ComEA family DNA-binding protein [Streptomyces rectiverticillatus]